MCWLARSPTPLSVTTWSTAWPNRNKTGETVRSILSQVLEGHGNLKKTNFLFFPESSLPYENLDDALALLACLRPNTVTVIGLGPITLGDYRSLLQRYAEDNGEALESVLEDLDSGDIETLPVNCCMITVKEDDGRLRVFFASQEPPLRRRGNPGQRPLPVPRQDLPAVPLPAQLLQLHGPDLHRLRLPRPVPVEHQRHHRKSQPALFRNAPETRPAGRHRVQSQTGACRIW